MYTLNLFIIFISYLIIILTLRKSQLIFLSSIEDASFSLPVRSCSWKTLSITWRTFSVITATSSGVVPSVGMGFSTLSLMIPAQMEKHS